jgi:hypothetical protein
MVYLNGKNNLFYKCDHVHTEIESPEAKLYSVEIPLTDGSLDVTNVLSNTVFYADREITIGLELRTVRGEWPMRISNIMNEIHGRVIQVEFDDDPRFYWTGRARVEMPEDHGATCGINIVVTARPFKRRSQFMTIYENNIGGSDTVTFTTVTPRTYFRFTVNGSGGMTDTQVTYAGETWWVPVGTSDCYGLFVTPGEHTFELYGTDDVIIETQEAIL